MKLDDVQDRFGKSEQGNVVDLIHFYSMSPSLALIFDATDHLGCFWMCSPCTQDMQNLPRHSESQIVIVVGCDTLVHFEGQSEFHRETLVY